MLLSVAIPTIINLLYVCVTAVPWDTISRWHWTGHFNLYGTVGIIAPFQDLKTIYFMAKIQSIICFFRVESPRMVPGVLISCQI